MSKIIINIISKPFLFIFLSAFMPLAAALISQYGFGLHPCKLCIYQRIPYVIIMALGVVLFFSSSKPQAGKFLIFLAVIAYLVNSGLGLYHVGVEQNWWTYGECSGKFDTSSFESFKNSILNAPNVRCDEIQFSFLGVSMAGWNFIYCLALAIFLSLQYILQREIIKVDGR